MEMIECVCGGGGGHEHVHMYQSSVWHAENTIYVIAIIGDYDNNDKKIIKRNVHKHYYI